MVYYISYSKKDRLLLVRWLNSAWCSWMSWLYNHIRTHTHRVTHTHTYRVSRTYTHTPTVMHTQHNYLHHSTCTPTCHWPVVVNCLHGVWAFPWESNLSPRKWGNKNQYCSGKCCWKVKQLHYSYQLFLSWPDVYWLHTMEPSPFWHNCANFSSLFLICRVMFYLHGL